MPAGVTVFRWWSRRKGVGCTRSKEAITAAIERVAAIDERLGRNLRTGIKTGLHCCYEPDPTDTIDWTLDDGI